MAWDEAKLLMLRHAFDVLGCNRVQIVTDELKQALKDRLDARMSRWA